MNLEAQQVNSDDSNSPLMLEVCHLQVGYYGVLAVSDASLKVKTGQIVALVGGNGNGKSSILRAIAGLNRPDAGQIFLATQPIHTLKAHQRVKLGLSLVPEGRHLFPRLSVLRNLELGAFTMDRQQKPNLEERLHQVFELFPILKERLQQMAGTMSGGEQQMVAIARGLMAQPKILLLDEPSWGVAPKLVSKILETIVTINRSGVTVLLVEQNLHKALGIAHYGYVLQTGRVVLQGPSSELIANEAVRKAYLGL